MERMYAVGRKGEAIYFYYILHFALDFTCNRAIATLSDMGLPVQQANISKIHSLSRILAKLQKVICLGIPWLNTQYDPNTSASYIY